MAPHSAAVAMMSTGDNSYEEPAVAMIGAVAGATQHNLLRAGQLGLGGCRSKMGGSRCWCSYDFDRRTCGVRGWSVRSPSFKILTLCPSVLCREASGSFWNEQ
jgi:hypothetical protein